MFVIAIVLVWMSGFLTWGAISCLLLGDMRWEAAIMAIFAVGFIVPIFVEALVR